MVFSAAPNDDDSPKALFGCEAINASEQHKWRQKAAEFQLIKTRIGTHETERAIEIAWVDVKVCHNIIDFDILSEIIVRCPKKVVQPNVF